MEYEIDLTTLAYGGDAIGRLADGRAVFVPFGLPGERVRIRLREEKRGFARAELLEVLQASPDRITPKCLHFGVCGGCHYQHLGYEKQLEAKSDILRDQLERIGKIAEPPVRPAVASPAAWYYRNHVQFHLTGDGKPGYVGAASPGVLRISECHLPEEPINSLWPRLDFEAGSPIERVALRLGADAEILLVLESDVPEPPEVQIEAGVSVVHAFEDHAIVLAGEDRLRMRVLDREFTVSAGSFFQVNTPMAGRMVEHVLNMLPRDSATLIDLYCGVGLFSAFLAPKCNRLIGVEASAAACEDFAANLDEFDHVELYEGAVEQVLPQLQAAPDFVVADPPRAGLERGALDALVALAPPRLVYVSCDPSTLARDAARLLAGGYRLLEVTPFDLFPQTYHIESISLFAR
jgi:23S rRNA (uracil1939-C5)-methyltransferase